MEDHLAPRNADGLIEPIEYHNKPPQEKLYPHFRFGSNGVRPIVFADEFADGRIPEDLEYLPGHEKPGCRPFDGTNLDVIVYDDPVQNLTYSQWLTMQQAQQLQTWGLSALLSAASAIQETQVPARTALPATKEGLQMQTDWGISTIANFDVIVRAKCTYIQRNQEARIEIQLTVRCLGSEHDFSFATTELDNALKLIQQRIPEAMVEKNASSQITTYIRRQLSTCPSRAILQSTGFALVGGQWIYVHDGAASPDSSTSFQTGKHIGCRPNLSPQNAFGWAMGVLALSSRQELMLPLLLLMHLGPLFELFRQAGYPPRFVTFLAGTTGSLKTSLSLAFFRLFAEDSEQPEANFLDTETALELKLRSACSRVLLVDDYCPAVTTTSGKQKLSKLEMVIRFIGDQISKSRSNPKLTLAEESSPACCCIVTGESTGGSRSTLLRCLVLSITKGDIDGTALERYQQDPLLLQTHFNHFLAWCGERGDLIIDFLKRESPVERCHFTKCVRERRLADTGACLMLTARLLLQYAVDIRAVNHTDRLSYEAQWRQTLEIALDASETATRDLDPITMFLKALFDLRQGGKLPLAPESASYAAEKHFGFLRNDQWWLRPTDTHQLVVKYWKGLGHIFPLRENETRKLLAANNLIETEHESTANGRGKTLYTCKSSLPNRDRMLVLRLDIARDHLERELSESCGF